ncbi:MAG: type I-E CRISPR-associated protein Cas7/Cse4/CasC [Acidimicrobiales bacterium]
MNLELHVIQNVAPANLNRDDTGAPKDAMFGGYRRARVSSQAWKRAVRQSFSTDFSADELAWRTKRLVEQVSDVLVGQGKDREQAEVVASGVLVAGGAGIDEKTHQTKVLWLVARSSIEVLVALSNEYWDDLVSGKKLSADASKAIKKSVVDKVVGARSVDIALFGRMLTDAPDGGTVDAAVQVAHALSTHAVDTEFDYFTAVDDLIPDEESGAGMLGTVEFNSACLYRYACVDTQQLLANLDGDIDLAKRASEAFAKGFVTVMPTGKQNTFAAHNPPAAALLVVRESGSWNLANAFADPVRTGRQGDLVGESCKRLAAHWNDLVAMYGDPAQLLAIATLPSLVDSFANVEGAQFGSLDESVALTADALAAQG